MASSETLPDRVPPRRPSGRRDPAFYGGLTAMDILVVQTLFDNPSMNAHGVGKLLWPKMKHPGAKVRRIWEKVQKSSDMASLMRQFGPDLPKIFSVINDALGAENVYVSKSGDIVTNPDHRTRLQAAKMVLDVRTPKGPQIVQNTTNITVERERRAAREFKATHSKEEVEQERLRLHEEWRRQQEAEGGDGTAPDTGEAG